MMSAAVQIVGEPLKQCETTVSLCLPLGESAKLQATWEKTLKYNIKSKIGQFCSYEYL